VGRAVHAAIHGLVMLPLAAPVLPRWWLAIPLVTALHFWVDGMKAEHAPERGPISLVVFLFDQAVHLGILLLGVLVTGLPIDRDVIYLSPAVTRVLYYAIPYVAATFGGSIFIYQAAVALGTRPNPLELLSPPMRALGIAERAFTLTVLLFLPPVWWWVGGVTTAVQVSANTGRHGRWLENVSGLLVTVAFGLAFR
jgi:hypothetical protein